MLKRIIIYLFLKKLEWKHFKNEEWQISDAFISEIVTGFKTVWLKNINLNTLIVNDIEIHYYKLFDLYLAIEDANKQMLKKGEIQLFNAQYSSRKSVYKGIDYFVDENNKRLDLMRFEQSFKKTILTLLETLKDCEGKSELEYGYYKRKLNFINSDILAIYWFLIQVAKS